ncbi:MAG: PRC-barrel domain-containing protein [Nanoarchaeota archaeon]|nr:PRC-barrel domain-containing protein [Nanoarchaeota archaeon]
MIITSDDILGKVALDSEGGVLGTVVKLHIDKKQKQMTGITVDQGFLKPDLFIGMNYIRTFGIDAILLNDVPLDTLKGKKVLTTHGSLIGSVKNVLSKGNNITKLVITSGRETLEVKASFIKEAGQSIVLRKNWHKK